MKQSKMAFSSLAFTLIVGSLFTLAISPARAEEEHPCQEYIKHCKAQELTPGHGLWKCVAKEAMKSNNEVCMAKLKEGAMKMREHKKHKEEAEKAAE